MLNAESNTNEKLLHLHQELREMGSALVAYSGGVDSTLLASIANAMLADNALMVLVRSKVVANSDIEDARKLANKMKFNFLEIDFDPLESEDFAANGHDRCYHCKHRLLSHLKAIAGSKRIDFVCEGSNYNDQDDYRPGLRAVKETGVRSPLLDAFVSKQEIRQIARQIKLPNWDRPAAPCLATRIAYGIPITYDILERIGAGEAYLKRFGISQVRLRHHGDIARVEVDGTGFTMLSDVDRRKQAVNNIQALGYKYVTLDLGGYRAGSMNE